jgi:hypothetical protein
MAGHRYKAIRALVYLPRLQRVERLGLCFARKSNQTLSAGGGLMYLYFLRSQNVVKVGIASDFASRLDAIRRGNFHPIEVLRTYGHWDSEFIKQLEREAHAELESVNEHHEFFQDGTEIRGLIDRLDRQFYPERFSGEPLIVPVQVQA